MFYLFLPAEADTGSIMTPLARFISLVFVFLMLACFVLPYQAAAQTVSIADVEVGEGDGFANFTVSLSQAVTRDTVLGLLYRDGTADLATDLRGTLQRSVTIPANSLSARFGVGILDDDIAEDAESFTVILGGVSLPPGVIFGKQEATGTILDNNRVTVSIAAAGASVEEGGSFTFTATLSQPVGASVTVPWTASGTGTHPATVEGDGSDLGRAPGGTVTFPINSTAQSFTIATRDDAMVEEDETFTVTVAGSSRIRPTVEVIAPDAGAGVTATILDDDVEPGLTTSIRIADAAAVAEGGTARFTIALEPRALTGDAVLDVAYAAGSATLEDLGRDRPATVRIPAGSRSVVLEVPIADDDAVEGSEAFTVTLSAATEQPDDPETGEPPGFILLFPRATATATITEDEAAPPAPARRLSVLIGPRLVGAGTALRRHVGRFDAMTGTVVRNRLDGRGMKTLTASQDLGSGAVAVGGSFDQNRLDQGRLDQGRWGAWIDGAWAGIGGNASGYQADVYGGVDYLAPNGAGLIGNWLIGALIGHEVADLDIGKATYRSRYTHVGLYGGARLWQHLLFDGAVTYGRATPDIALGDVSASHDANRITARGALTGDFGIAYGLWTGSVRIEPQLGVLYARERLGAFTDSAGGVGQGETLELGRFSAGPRLTWAFDGGRLTGGARVQWDFLELEDGVSGRVSGAADIGVTLDLAPNVTLGVQGDVDGIGIGDDFGSLGGTVELKARF